MSIWFKVIILNGSGGVGKDTLVDFVEEKAQEKNIQIARFSTVDRVNEALKVLGWDGTTKDEAYRAFASETKFASSKFNNGPTEDIKKRIYGTLDATEKSRVLFFVMCREPKEIQKLQEDIRKQQGGDFKAVSSVLIENSNVPKIESNEADKNVENFVYEHHIDNSGSLEDLSAKAEDLLKLAETTLTFFTPVVSEPGKDHGFEGGQVISNFEQDLTKVNIRNFNWECQYVEEGEGGFIPGALRNFRELKVGDCFIADDAPSCIYKILTPVKLWRPEGADEYTWSVHAELLMDMDNPLKEDLYLDKVTCKQTYRNISFFSDIEPDTPFMTMDLEALRKMYNWSANLFGNTEKVITE